MPAWALIALGAGLMLLVAAAVAVAILGWRTYVSRTMLRLVGRSEAIFAAADALIDTVERLSEASDEEIELFADDPESIERRALAEVRSRANILATELDHMPLPRKLVATAEALADAAYLVCRQADIVEDDDTGLKALEALGSIDLGSVRAYTQKARSVMRQACDECGVDDTAVYGGGLYL